jgi:hypothetical protein
MRQPTMRPSLLNPPSLLLATRKMIPATINAIPDHIDRFDIHRLPVKCSCEMFVSPRMRAAPATAYVVG